MNFKVIPDVEQAKIVIDKKLHKIEVSKKRINAITFIIWIIISTALFKLFGVGRGDIIASLMLCPLLGVLPSFVILASLCYDLESKENFIGCTKSKEIIDILTGNYTIIEYKDRSIRYIDNSDPCKIVEELSLIGFTNCSSMITDETTIDLINFKVVAKYGD